MADPNKRNTEGRKAGKPGPERYPSTRQDDGVEGGEARSFQPQGDHAKGEQEPPPLAHDRQGPAGDPAEGKR